MSKAALYNQEKQLLDFKLSTFLVVTSPPPVSTLVADPGYHGIALDYVTGCAWLGLQARGSSRPPSGVGRSFNDIHGTHIEKIVNIVLLIS